MKDLLIQTAKRTGLVDSDQLSKFLEENNGHGRIDEVLLNCPYFTEDIVLKLFAAALGWEYLSDTANIEKMIDYIEDNGGSIDAVLGSGLPPKRETILSGPLNRRLMDVVNKN